MKTQTSRALTQRKFKLRLSLQLIASAGLLLFSLTLPVLASSNRDIDAALDYINLHPTAAAKRFSPAYIARLRDAQANNDYKQLQNESGPIITLPDGRRHPLQPDFVRAAEWGASLRILDSRANRVKSYTVLYSLSPPSLQKQVVAPSQLAKLSNAEISSSQEYMNTHFPASTPVTDFVTSQHPPTLSACQAEIGYQDGTDQDPPTCTTFSNNGIMRLIDFPLRNDLTCVKNQGRRKTCVAFSTTAALETSISVQHGIKVNLSEQHAYWYGKTHLAYEDRNTDGMNLLNYVEHLGTHDYEFKQERVWDYNPSRDCDDYSGGTCSSRVHQGEEVLTTDPVLGINIYFYPDPNPNAGAYRVDSSVEIDTNQQGLEFAKILLHSKIPLVAGFGVTDNFRNPDADGYINYVPGQPADGGHAVELVGWVDNANLPQFAPNGAGGGYFVAKNSWGDTSGDCGYYYLPASYLLDYGTGLALIQSD